MQKTVLFQMVLQNISLNLKGVKIVVSDKITHPGKKIFSDRLDKEIWTRISKTSTRISKTSKGFGSMKAVYEAKVPAELKASLLISYTYLILTHLTYGSQIWAITNK